MKRVLIATGFYLPGYKGGGLIRAIVNLVEFMGDEFNFSILTADRDLGDNEPYPALVPNNWQAVGKARVKYLTPDQMTLKSWARQIRQSECDLIYLNGFFARQTRQTLMLRRLLAIPQHPIVLAPRGEFSPGALGLKSMKKRVYIQLIARLGLYNDLTWQATSNTEMSDLQKNLGQLIPDMLGHTLLAADLAAPMPAISALSKSVPKQVGSVRIIFLSRISRKKNLDFALTLLRDIEQIVTFDIYGPKEDLKYWEECQQIIRTLPSNVRVMYCGVLAPEEVNQVLFRYHLFFLPTLGENFGYAIVEAWAAGCPVLISDQTPWRQLEEKGVGWDLPLAEPERFRDALRQIINMDQAEFSLWSERARQFAMDLVQQQSQNELRVYQQLFQMATKSKDWNGNV